MDKTYHHTRRLLNPHSRRRNEPTKHTKRQFTHNAGSQTPRQRNTRRHSFHRNRRRRILHHQRRLQKTIHRKTRLRPIPGHTERKTHHRLRHKNPHRTRSIPRHRNPRLQKRKPHLRQCEMLSSHNQQQSQGHHTICHAYTLRRICNRNNRAQLSQTTTETQRRSKNQNRSLHTTLKSISRLPLHKFSRTSKRITQQKPSQQTAQMRPKIRTLRSR